MSIDFCTMKIASIIIGNFFTQFNMFNNKFNFNVSKHWVLNIQLSSCIRNKKQGQIFKKRKSHKFRNLCREIYTKKDIFIILRLKIDFCHTMYSDIIFLPPTSPKSSTSPHSPKSTFFLFSYWKISRKISI